jgi:hypothetical protein
LGGRRPPPPLIFWVLICPSYLLRCYSKKDSVMNYLRIKRSSCRGRAFPQKSTIFQIILAWECSAQATQGQVIDESTKGLAFAFQADRGEYKNIGANAKPLQVYVYRALRARITDDTNSKERRFYGYSLGFSSSRT